MLPPARVWCYKCGFNQTVQQVPHPEIICPECGTLIAKENALDPLTHWDERFAWSHGLITLTCSNCSDTRFSRAPLISEQEVRCKSCGGRINWQNSTLSNP